MMKKTPKYNPKKGEENGNSKLDCDAVEEIRALFKKGRSSRNIASEFGIAKTTVLNIIHRKTWKHL